MTSSTSHDTHQLGERSQELDQAWGQIDHNLVGLELTDIAEDMHKIHLADVARIRDENRLNDNKNEHLRQRLKTSLQRLDECGERYYQAYCDTWAAQGERKSAVFVRCVYQHAIVPLFDARMRSVKSEISSENGRTRHWLHEILNAAFSSFDGDVERLKRRWARKIKREAKGREYAGSQSELVDVQKAEHVKPVAQEKGEKTAFSSAEPTSNGPSNQDKGEADIREVAPGAAEVKMLVDTLATPAEAARVVKAALRKTGLPYRAVKDYQRIVEAVKYKKKTCCTFPQASEAIFGNRGMASKIAYHYRKLEGVKQ